MADTTARIVISAKDETTGALARVRSGLDRLKTTASGIGTALGSVGLAVGGIGAASAALVGLVRSTTNSLDALNDLKDATGASIENLSALEDVAARTGTSFDTVGTALVKFNQVLNAAEPDSAADRVLKALNLSAAELRKLDPAEALRRTAVALAGYADDGNKARAVQELFGRSIREVAPLLADLAKQGQLNATVTTAQAEAAERFNQNLAALGKSSTDFARNLVSDLLPALNEVFVRIRAANQEFGGFGKALLANLGKRQFTDAAEGAVFYGKQLADLQKQREIIARDPNSVARRGGLADIDAEIQSTEKLLRFYRNVNAQTQQATTVGADFSDRSRGVRELAKSLEVLDAKAKPKKERETRSAVDFLGVDVEAVKRALDAIEDTDISKVALLERQLAALFDLQRETRGDPAVVRAIRATQDEIDKLRATELGAAVLDPKEQTKIDFLRSEKEAYTELGAEVVKVDKAQQELGLTFASAFEEAIVGGQKFSDVLKGLADDIVRLIVRRSIIEPITNSKAFGGAGASGGGFNWVDAAFKAFGGSFATGGTLGAGKWGIAGEAGPEIIRGPATVQPMTGAAGARFDFSIGQINVGEGVSRGEVAAALAQANALQEAKFRRMLARA